MASLKQTFDQLQFQFPFRKYQKLILDQVDSTKDKDTKFHIVAPPGSGKTIVGLELIKRFSEPAVVFAPTSTIQLQWKEKLAMFIPNKSGPNLNQLASIKPDKLTPVNIYTYQLLSSPAENLDFVKEAALVEWQDNLVGQGVVSSLEEAVKRTQLLKENNPTAYAKELSKQYKKLKDRYLRDPEFDGTKFLHKNAQKLIDDLVGYGVKVIIMDEVHHLLDYWALVIKELIKRIDGVKLIGLTATPPLSADDEELQNYISIMGNIDFEIPTPAVVKEGNLAPYQDLVFFCTPTKKEKDFIDSLQSRFQSLIENIAQRETFKNWVLQRIIDRPTSEGKKQDWTAFFNSHLFLAIAGVKYVQQVLGYDPPNEIVEIEEMEKDLTIDDWVYLLADYSLNFLKISNQKEHHDELLEISGVLKSFGYVLTEQGIRQQRSPSDKILALSEAKNESLVKILQTEMEVMGNHLRAVVITDFEKQSATETKYLSGILDQESGGAVRAFKYIAHDPQTTKLEPILLTGTTVLIDIDELKTILKSMEEWKEKSGLHFSFETKPTQYEKIVELTGSGPDWKSNTYVRMVTELFDKGIIRCIVGTRGLLGEGWDSLSLNTLIDLTQATTSMTVNQIRGRSIRLDPNWPTKVANNWDVVCIDPSFEKGDQDFERFLSKHKHFYGLGAKKKIVKGYLHVDEKLGVEYQNLGFKKVLYHLVNNRMLSKARDRDHIYQDWGIGDQYSNFEYAATKLDAEDIKFKTVYQLKDSLKAIFNSILAGVGVFAFWYYYVLQQPIIEAVGTENSTAIIILSAIFVAGVLLFTARNIKKYITKGFIEVPIDSFILDIGKSLTKSLREAGLISPSQSIDNVRVVKDATSYYDLYLDYATKQDAQAFSNCLKEVLSPVTNQRYLVSRSIDNIKIGFYSPIWWFVRTIFRIARQEKIAYHPVPAVFSINKKRAEIFAKNWQEYVGGGELIYTRSNEGTELLLKLRKYNRHKIKKMNYEIWK
jgi:superfamily II DNA or RNA helicase